MPSSSPSEIVAIPSWPEAANSPSTSATVSPQSSSARSEACAIRSTGVMPCSTWPRSDSATPAMATPVNDHPRIGCTGRSRRRRWCPLEDGHAVVEGDAHPHADLPAAAHGAHHPKALVEVDERDVVRLLPAAVHRGRRVDGPQPSADAPFVGAHARVEDRTAAVVDLVGELTTGAVLGEEVGGRGHGVRSYVVDGSVRGHH